MKKLLMAFLFTIAFMAVQAQPKHVVISQVFGAGGLTNSPLSHDFVELYNPTASAVSLEGWSVQYSPATNDRWGTGTVTLSGSMAPGTYFLIQLNGKDGVGKALPAPDLIASVNIDVSATSGKFALVNSVVALQSNCPVGSTIIDFVGYGSADCFETTVAPATSNTKSIVRINNGCADTDDNKADFITAAPSPRNSSSPANSCNSGTISVTAVSTLPFCINPMSGAAGTVAFNAAGNFPNTTFNALLSDGSGSFTAPVVIGSTTVNGSNPSGTIAVQIPKALPTSKSYRIRIDAVSPSITGQANTAIEIINGAANVNTFSTSPNATETILNWVNPGGCFDEILIVAKEGSSITGVPSGDGSAYAAQLDFSGNGTAFDGGNVVYKGASSGQKVTGLETGKEYFFKAFTRNGNYWSSGFEIKVRPRLLPQPGEILINQASPEYGDPSHEYIELVNVTGKTFDLSELNISYHAASGNTGTVGKRLAGMLQPHSYWLLASMDTVAVGKTKVASDGNFTGRYAAGSGQLALVRLSDNVVIDGFGYGKLDSITYTETAPAPAPLSKGGFKRKWEGFDTDNNSLDFERVANADIDLRNSSSRLANEGAAISGGDYTRLYVTGNAQAKGNINILEKLVLQKGLLQLSDHHLTAKAVEGGSVSNYIQTNGGGTFTMEKMTDEATVLPIGNATYNPVLITNGSGANWQVHVADSIAHQPTTFYEEKAVLRTWMVKPLAAPANGATIQLIYNEGDASQLGKDFNKAEVQVWNFNDNWAAAGAPHKPDGVNGAQAAHVTNWKADGVFVIANPIAEMSLFTVLPIKFMDVKATELPHAIQINFTNLSESDVAHYEMQRSANGIDFSTVATLQPLHNNGGAARYQWLDKERLAGDNFYRIKGVEKGGKLVYSPIVKIKVDRSQQAFAVFPNPVVGRQVTWQASLPSGNYQLYITGSNGQQVLLKRFTWAGGNISQNIQLPAGLTPGVYSLQLRNGNYLKYLSIVVL